jgi:uncharacterized membrane protein
MKELAGTLLPGGSALFVLIGMPSPDRENVLKDLSGAGGKILTTSLSHADEAKLQDALRAAKVKVKEQGSRLNKQQISLDVSATSGESCDGWHGRLD